mmetsp:Transcript_23651/g.58624  ORF Transcript_23651/g.58624 Transcript_23651/m.58624 type:complete len:303 (+) Transcript_23651:245-1153(+)
MFSIICAKAVGSLPLMPTIGGPKRRTSTVGSPATTQFQWCIAIVALDLCSVTTTFFSPDFDSGTSSISHMHSSGTMSRSGLPDKTVSPFTAIVTDLVSSLTIISLDLVPLGIRNSTVISRSLCVHRYLSVMPPHSSDVRFFMPPSPSSPMLPPACKRAMCTLCCRCISSICSGLCANVSASVAVAAARPSAAAAAAAVTATVAVAAAVNVVVAAVTGTVTAVAAVADAGVAVAGAVGAVAKRAAPPSGPPFRLLLLLPLPRYARPSSRTRACVSEVRIWRTGSMRIHVCIVSSSVSVLAICG